MVRNLKNAPKYSSQSVTDRPPYWQQDHSFLTFRMRSNYEIAFLRHNLSTNQPFLSPVSGVAKCRLFPRLARITFYESLLIGQKTSARCKYKASGRKAWFDMTVFVCLLTDVALFFIFNSRRARERKIYFLLPPPLPHCASGHLITRFFQFSSRALGGRLRENRESLNRLVFVNARNVFLLGRFCVARCLLLSAYNIF